MFPNARWYSVALLVFLLGFGAGQARGQGVGAIEGTVTDTQQLPLPGATVEVLNQQGTSVAKITNLVDGTYRVDQLAGGTYTVQFSRDGFQLVRKEKVMVTAGQTARLDASLPPQSLSTNVTVTAQVDDQNIASKTDIPAAALPVTVETVPLEMIEQQADLSVIPVINNLPAAYAWTQYGSLNYFEFRGMVMDEDPGSALLLNGIPIQGNRADSQLNSIQEVDVLKGPASMLYGTQDPGGTINIVEKQPLAESQQDLVLHGGYWGTNGVEFGSTGPLTQSKNLLYRVDVGYLDSNGFRGAGYKKLNLTPKLFWRITPKDRLRLNFSWNDDHFDLDAGMPLIPEIDSLMFPTSNTWLAPTGVNINTRYNIPGTFENLNTPIVQGFYEHDFNDNMTLRASVQFQGGSDEYWQNEGNAVDIETNPYTVLRGNCPLCFNVFFYHHDWIGFNQDDLVGSFHLWFKHQYMIGYELDQFYHKTARSSAAEGLNFPSETLINPVETAAAVTYFPSTGSDAYDGIRSWQNAIYFQDFMNIHPKLQVLVGGRYDGYYNYNFEYDQNGSEGFDYSTSNAFAQHPFTYRVGVISPLAPMVTLYANWATSWTAQTELSTAGNPLKPESGQQIEAGARLRFAQDRINLNLAYFNIVERNVAITLPNEVIIQVNGQKSYGAEAELRARVTSKFNLYATYGVNPTYFLNFETTNYIYGVPENLGGLVPPLVPKITQRLWVTYQLPKGFLVMAGDQYASKRATDQFDIFWMPGYVTFQAGLTYRRARMEYSVNLENLLNTKYWVSAIDDTQIYPGQPFNIVATARFHFGKQ